jgi:hypothetical protein
MTISLTTKEEGKIILTIWTIAAAAASSLFLDENWFYTTPSYSD